MNYITWPKDQIISGKAICLPVGQMYDGWGVCDLWYFPVTSTTLLVKLLWSLTYSAKVSQAGLLERPALSREMLAHDKCVWWPKLEHRVTWSQMQRILGRRPCNPWNLAMSKAQIWTFADYRTSSLPGLFCSVGHMGTRESVYVWSRALFLIGPAPIVIHYLHVYP